MSAEVTPVPEILLVKATIGQKYTYFFGAGYAEGTGKMKPIKTLSAADLDNVVAFTRSLKKK